MLRKEAEKVLAPPLQKGIYPFFSFSDKSMEDVMQASVNMSLTNDHLMFMETGHKGKGRHRKSRMRDELDGLTFSDQEDFVVVDCMQRTDPDVDPEILMSEEVDDFQMVNGLKITAREVSSVASRAEVGMASRAEVGPSDVTGGDEVTGHSQV